MALVPLTFAYAIVRFRLFDVQLIVGKSIVYAILTAIVTGLYALAVVAGNALVSSQALFSSPLFAFAFGLAVVLLFDPLRRRMQAIVDRVFFRDRADFQAAFLDMSRQVVAQLDRGKMQQLLTERTADLLRLTRLDLLTPRPEDGALADPRRGEEALPVGAALGRMLAERDAPVVPPRPRLGEPRRGVEVVPEDAARAGACGSSSRSRRAGGSSGSSRRGRRSPRRSSTGRTSTTSRRSRTRGRSASRWRRSTSS